MRDRITQRQFEVLELLAQYKTSKEIGTALGISQFAVDQRIRSVVTRLKVINRRDAANLFRVWEREEENAGKSTADNYLIEPADNLPDPREGNQSGTD